MPATLSVVWSPSWAALASDDDARIGVLNAPATTCLREIILKSPCRLLFRLHRQVPMTSFNPDYSLHRRKNRQFCPSATLDPLPAIDYAASIRAVVFRC